MFMRDFWKPMPVSGKPVRELLLLFLLLWIQQSYAQRITRQYNNVSFSAALKDLNARQHKYTINFVYDELEDFRSDQEHQKPECSRCHHAADRILSHQDDAGGG